VSPSSRTATIARRYLASAAWLIAGLTIAGCASPGPPRAPSLQLPEPVHDLTVSREGDHVAIHFTLPQRTTDNLPIRQGAVRASLCSGPEGSPCDPLASRQNITLPLAPGAAATDRTVAWTDNLPPAGTTGEPQLLAYRLRLSNLQGKSAGWSEPSYTASGAAPHPVDGFHAQETRSGILLQWQPGGRGEVLLHRESLAPSPDKKNAAEPTTLWLATHAEPTGPQANQTIDSSATEDVPYRYTAVRRRIVELGQQKVELRSAISSPVEITWRNMFPPPAPAGLSAAPLSETGGFAVDLVWEPVEEPRLEGYIVTRQADGSAPEILTPQPIPIPAFHDATAKPGVRYQYSVLAVGHKGTHGTTAVVTVEPTGP
jgi:hypothetical protein